jgi:microcin C transport system substrate-binding protein
MSILLCALFVGAAHTQEPSHGLSYFGELKYSKDFDHFDYVNPDAPKGGTVKIAGVLKFNNLHFPVNGGVTQLYMDVRRYLITYDRLMKKSEDELASYYGLLAESVEVADDYSWVDYALRRNAYWHDGVAVTLDDVLWTFNTLKTEGSIAMKSAYRDWERIEQTGPWNFRFHFSETAERTPRLAVQTAGFVILPKHYWTEKNRNGEFVRDFTSTTLDPPLGNGAYRIAEVEQGQKITFERVEDYWGRDLAVNEGHHNFDRIEAIHFFDDGVRLQALKAGVIDYYRDEDEKAFATGYNFAAVDTGLFNKETYSMGMPFGMHWGIVLNTRREKFKDIRVREALALAYNFDWSNRVLGHGGYLRNDSYFMGSAMAATGLPSEAELELLEPYRNLIPSRVFTHEPRLPQNRALGRNREALLQADELLEEAGWVVRDFKRVHKDTGEPYTIEFVVFMILHERMLVPFVDNLKRLGIDAKIRRVESNIMATRRRNYDYDSMVWKFYQFKIPISHWLRSNFLSRNVDVTDMRNFSGVDNPAVDFLVEKVISANSEAELTAAGRALDRVLLWSFYLIPEGYPKGRHLLYWDRFGHPPLGVEHMDWTGFPYLWWFDEKKSARVDAGIAELKEN